MIVISPTHNWLVQAVEECTDSLSVSSPYVGSYLPKVVSQLDAKVSLTLLTRTTLADFASSASDLDAVRALAREAVFAIPEKTNRRKRRTQRFKT